MSSASATLASIATGSQKPVATGSQKLVYIPPINRCEGCQNRLRFTNGDEKKPIRHDSSGIFDCLCGTCNKCGALYDYCNVDSFTYGGPCNCGNTAFTM